MATPIHTPRKHTVPTHLNLPDQVVTLWSFSMTARQLLLALVGGGLGGNLWRDLASLSHHGVPGLAVRGLVALLPFLLALLVGYSQHAGRSLEVWAFIILRYALQSNRFVWRTIRTTERYWPVAIPGAENQEPTLKISAEGSEAR